MITYILNRFHPLWRLRQWPAFRRLQSWIDFPVSRKTGKVKVAIFWFRNLKYLLMPESIEQEVGRRFDLLLTGFKPELFLDVGANIGSYSWRAINLVDQTEIWMFEPDKNNARLVRRTIAQNDLKRVTLHEAAVSDANGTIEFVVDDASGTAGSIEDYSMDTGSLHHAYGMGKTQTVSCVQLDFFCDQLLGKRVLIKIDVEGAEDRVLQGARRILKEVRPVILLECFILKKIAWLADAGYLLHDLKEGGNHLAFPQELKEKIEIEWS